MIKRKIMCILLLIVFVVTAIGVTVMAADKPTVRVGSKNFPEQYLLGEMLIQLLEANGYNTKDYTGLGSTDVAHKAIINGEIDILPAYTGTGLMTVLGKPMETDPDKTYKIVKESYKDKWDIVWLNRFGFNNTWAFVVTEESKHETISDLAEDKDAIIDMYMEFIGREDGWEGIKKLYGFETPRGNITTYETAIAYQKLVSGDIDATVALSTDAMIQRFDLKILEDNKNFFPPYDCAPIIRGEILEKDPEIENIINKLGGKITQEKIVELKYKVTVDDQSYEKVVKEFLDSQELI